MFLRNSSRRWNNINIISQFVKESIVIYINNNISDIDVKPFINEWYYERFLNDRKNKDDFFTDRESAIIFGLPSCFIEGVLVGRKYESDEKMLSKIKELLPDCYICNLDGKVIF